MQTSNIAMSANIHFSCVERALIHFIIMYHANKYIDAAIIQKILHSKHRVHLRVLYGPQNQQ